MEKWELIAPCHFGLEAVLKREIQDLGYEILKVEDGKVTFLADAQGIADANVFLRTTERILLKVADVKSTTFEELFDKMLKAVDNLDADCMEEVVAEMDRYSYMEEQNECLDELKEAVGNLDVDNCSEIIDKWRWNSLCFIFFFM